MILWASPPRSVCRAQRCPTQVDEPDLQEAHSCRRSHASQAFDGYQSVKTDASVYPIADDVPVFVSRTNQLITLRQAKADYDAFVLYADAPLSEGGRICMISVS